MQGFGAYSNGIKCQRSGIDIDELSHVFNYDLPNVPETYVHRIGRTGRAGLRGISISFCNIEEKPYLKDIEKLTGNKIDVNEDHSYPMMIMTVPEKEKTSGRQPRSFAQKAETAQNSRRRKPSKKK